MLWSSGIVLDRCSIALVLWKNTTFIQAFTLFLHIGLLLLSHWYFYSRLSTSIVHDTCSTSYCSKFEVPSPHYLYFRQQQHIPASFHKRPTNTFMLWRQDTLFHSHTSNHNSLRPFRRYVWRSARPSSPINLTKFLSCGWDWLIYKTQVAAFDEALPTNYLRCITEKVMFFVITSSKKVKIIWRNRSLRTVFKGYAVENLDTVMF